MSTSTASEQVVEPDEKSSVGRRVWRGFGGVFGGFHSFILRGNVIELAVGVVIGVAFNALVTGFTSDFIQPLIKVFSGGKALAGTFTLNHQAFKWADFVNQVVNFILVAAVLYFAVVMPMNRIAERRARAAAGPKPPAADIVLLTEIRDALVAANRRAGAGPGDGGGAANPAQAAAVAIESGSAEAPAAGDGSSR